jgi:hypothetical protein
LYIQQVESRSRTKDALGCNFLQYIDSQDVRRATATASCLVRYLLDSIVTLYDSLTRQNQSVLHESHFVANVLLNSLSFLMLDISAGLAHRLGSTIEERKNT